MVNENTFALSDYEESNGMSFSLAKKLEASNSKQVSRMEMTAANKIKIALYKIIFKQFKYGYIAVPEVTIAGNIADMLVVNGDIHIYEIKSKTDSLKRLPKQVETFSKYANKVTIVAHEKFIYKLTSEPYMNNIGIISVDDKDKLKHIKEPQSLSILTPYYLAYFNTIELRETLRGIPQWYKLSFIDAEQKLLELLNPDEIRRLTLFRIKEKFFKEFIRRRGLIKNKKEIEALQPRFEQMDTVNITSLAEIPYKVFRDFNFYI
ncbi:MAG: sce7726 family protein [bacterium]